MENSEFMKYLLDGIDPNFIKVFYIMAAIGFIFSLVMHVNKKRTKTEGFKFDHKFYFFDNLSRVCAGIILIVVFPFLFKDLEPWIGSKFVALGLPYTLNRLTGFLLGYFIDKILIFVRNKTNFKWFQSKKS